MKDKTRAENQPDETKSTSKPVEEGNAKPRKVFEGMGDYLASQPIHYGLTADEAINEDRDSRP